MTRLSELPETGGGGSCLAKNNMVQDQEMVIGSQKATFVGFCLVVNSESQQGSRVPHDCSVG
jgi:hypothetical protein